MFGPLSFYAILLQPTKFYDLSAKTSYWPLQFYKVYGIASQIYSLFILAPLKGSNQNLGSATAHEEYIVHTIFFNNMTNRSAKLKYSLIASPLAKQKTQKIFVTLCVNMHKYDIYALYDQMTVRQAECSNHEAIFCTTEKSTS